MTRAKEDIDERLQSLAEQTAAVGASAGFSARVMERLSRRGASVWTELGASARWLMPVFALAAAIAVVWAVSSEELSTELIASTETAELEW